MYLRKNSPKFFPAVPFFLLLQIKSLSNCPYFKKPPLPCKISGYAPEYRASKKQRRNKETEETKSNKKRKMNDKNSQLFLKIDLSNV